MGVIRQPDQRVAIIIDTQNLYHSAKNLYKAKVHFANVVKAALGERKLIRATAYVVNTESGEEQPFFEAMEKLGIEIKTKDLQIFYGGAKKADWDVGMVVDAIKLAKKVDAIVFATGDGDFIPGVEYIKNQGCQVEGITFGRSASSAFRVAVDDFIDLDEDPSTFLMNYRVPKNKNSKKKAPAKNTTGKKGAMAKKKTKSNPTLKKQLESIITTGTDTDDME